MLHQYLNISEEVKDALAEKRPVVALESTIISHGMPYPQNVETAFLVEKMVRDNGAIPATIALMNGKMKAGLSPDEVETLGKKGREVIKVSRRDIPMLLAKKEMGATTVASTMIVAALANIKIFATGGIGGVHRGAQETFDISADLQELANTNVAVITAGAKSILDLPLTLEYLETHGVPVLGYQTSSFPAFFCRESGLNVDYQCDSVEVIAEMLRIKWQIPSLKGGVIVANPVPEAYNLDKKTMDEVIEKALQDAIAQGVKGKETTPFLLAAIDKITGGTSLKTNIQLVLNNAVLGAKIAVAYAGKEI
jgi:pseudouridine-5'-phosphate glycosidase